MDQETTDDAFLGGKVQALQPQKGFRAGLDTVMLAAAIPTQAGEAVIEAGCGPGVAALCLAARLDGVNVTGIEIEPEVAALARENVARNELADRIAIIEADVTAKASDLEAEGLKPETFAHAMANPPYLASGTATPPPGAHRARAFAGDPDLIEAWVKFCVRMVRPGGTVTFIHRADRLGDLLAAFERRTGNIRVLPFWPSAGKPASRVLVQGTKGSNAPLVILPGMALHGPDGTFLPQPEAILRNGAALPLDT